MSRAAKKGLLLILAATLLAAFVGLLCSEARAWGYPSRAERYRRELIRCAQYVFGLGAPVAALAAQVHQESAWNPEARSAYASGLAQFTPDTARDMARWHPGELGPGLASNPRESLLALCLYNKRLLGMFPNAATEADRWGLGLASYNGGAGHILKERAVAKVQGLDPERWFGHVETVRGSRALVFWRENRDYPRRILLQHQALYRDWGPGVDVSGVAK